MPEWVIQGIKEGGLLAVTFVLLGGWWHMYGMYKLEREERKELSKAFLEASLVWKDAINDITTALTLIKDKVK